MIQPHILTSVTIGVNTHYSMHNYKVRNSFIESMRHSYLLGD